VLSRTADYAVVRPIVLVAVVRVMEKPMKKSKLPLLFISLSLCVGATARADCSFPKAPASIPNGSTATEPEMVAAMQAFKAYNAEVTAYGQCLEGETQAKVKDGMSPIAIREFKIIQTKKNNTAVDDLKTKVKEFNDQVHVFKSRNS
jgi:hypothetical protein